MTHPLENKQRLLSLDVFRGLTLIWMIIVNSPGTYGQLSHAYWDGLTIADFVFPFFIFISGVTIAFHGGTKLTNTKPNQPLPHYYRKVAKRTALLFLLGLCVNLLYTEFSAFRIAGVLQRIAIVYGVCAVLVMHFHIRQLIYIGIGILVFYWFFLLWVPAPGIEAGVLERGNNIANWIDLHYLPGMLWRGTWDPEGIVSTLPAVVTGVCGVLAGTIVRKNQALPERINLMFVAGFCALLIGYVWSFYFLFNKALWSSSFVLVTGGVALLLLALFMWLIDLKDCHRFILIPQVFGTNAIAAYVLHVVFEKGADQTIAGISLHHACTSFFSNLGLPQDAVTIIWITISVFVCFAPLYVMYKKRLFIRI